MAAAFEELGVAPELIKAAEELGWTLPTPVQAEAVPLILGGGDVMAAAETGSGKTGAFALPVLQIVHESLTGAARSAAAASAAAHAAGGAPAPGRRCELSSEDRDAVLSVRGGTRAQCRQERSWGGGRATLGAFAGRVYYEAEVCDEGLCRVGWATQAASYDIGTDRHSFGFGGTGKKSHARQFEDYGRPFGAGDVVGCLLDADAGSVSFTVNGQAFPPAFALPRHLQGQVLYPAISLKNAELALNFGGPGDPPLRHGPPQGYTPLGAAPPSVTAAAADVAAAAAANAGAGGGGGGERRPLCLVLEPSRDLAEQTHACFERLGRHLTAPPLSCVLLVGGLDAGAQLRALKAGCDIAVGTPGRVQDFVDSGKLSLAQVRFFVLDEADRLAVDADSVVTRLFQRLPKGGGGVARLQVLMFSATLHSPEVEALAGRLCDAPLRADLRGRDALPTGVHHAALAVDPAADASWLQSVPQVYTDAVHACDAALKGGSGGAAAAASPEGGSEAVKRLKQRLLQRLIDAHGMTQALIFCRTNYDCDNLEKFLLGLDGGTSGASGGGAFRGKRESGREHAYSCVVLAGGRTMDERRAALQAFKDGDVRFLIATDVGARGLDVAGLPYVINMTLPERPEDYVHRVGRVGRADHMGLAISLVASVPEKVWYCTVKGYKPWLEPSAANTRTQEQGGHTVWYDEPALLRAIEARLGSPLPRLSEDLSLPSQLVQRLEGEGGAYGQARGGSSGSAEAAQRLASIRHNVERLVALERQAQTSFHALQRKWAAAGAGRRQQQQHGAGGSATAMDT